MTYYKHPITKKIEEVSVGFNWFAFFFGSFWLLYRGLWGQAIGFFFLGFMIGLIFWPIGLAMWIWVGFCANEWLEDNLISKGFKKIK